jgi:hypothetical protein
MIPEAGFHFEVLSRAQSRLMPKLAVLKQHGFYLAGGTALALHLGHRTSVDFDFYSLKSFTPEPFLSEITRNVRKATQIQVQENTLILECDRVQTSLFHYPCELLRPLVEANGVLLASAEDIAAMKLVAIIQRGRRRDFIDIYYLLPRMGLKTMLELARRKYPDFNVYLSLQALTYFGDAEPEEVARAIRTHVAWKVVQETILREVEQLRKSL